MLHDISSYPVTCSKQEAVELYNRAVEAFVSHREKLLSYLEQAVELDGSFLLAHCFLVGIYVFNRPLVNDCTVLTNTVTCLYVLLILLSYRLRRMLTFA